MTNTITNPILPGFNPDPSILRVGKDYYIATSTFEWYPGVQIHHSTDLVNWKLITRPLRRPEQLDMRGEPDSCGVWAPCLTYSDGLFWLAYTDVKRYDGNFKDTHNYLVTTDDITGDWSDPVYLNSSGFDPSLFHDTNGKKYISNMVWSHHADPTFFYGIVLQEYDHETKRLTGEPKMIFKGSDLGSTEGPHIYWRNGWYYLLTAEGGTGINHAMTLARSRSIDGDYELHPNSYLLTAKDSPENPLQRCGHGDIVETEDGQTYVVFLSGRPYTHNSRCILGRETSIQKAYWGDDDWLYLENKSLTPGITTPAPYEVEETTKPEIIYYDFNEAELPDDFQWLRTPYKDRIFSLSARAGHLRLFGRESIGSWYEQALVARRQTEFDFTATTSVDFNPTNAQQLAGLICYYNRTQFHFLSLSYSESEGRVIQIISCNGDYREASLTLGEKISVPDSLPVHMRATATPDTLNFSFSLDNNVWKSNKSDLDMTILSDEGGRGEHACFTGAFVGMVCCDVTGMGLHADFDYFTYQAEKS